MPRIYASADRRRFFLVPDDVKLRSGDLTVQSLTGERVAADGAQLEPYQVDEATARAQVEQRRRVAGDLVRELNAFAQAIERFGREAARPAAPERLGELLHACGLTEEDLARDPKAALARVLDHIGSAVSAQVKRS
jgi:hypothetical protein